MVRPARIPTVAFVLVAAAGAVIILTVLPDIVRPVGGPELETLKEHQKQALAITLEMNKLVISLGSLVFGAIGALIIGKEDFRVLNRMQIALALTTLLGATSALYFSYLVYDKLVEMLSNKFLTLNDGAILMLRSLQVDSLGVSVVTLAALFVSMVSRASIADTAVDAEQTFVGGTDDSRNDAVHDDSNVTDVGSRQSSALGSE